MPRAALWILLTALASPVHAAEPGVGDPAPEFSLEGSDGQTHALASYRGRQGVVLAWFPAAFTPG